MFEIKDGEKIHLESNETSREKLLIAEGVKEIYALKNKAGVNSNEEPKKGFKVIFFMAINWIFKLSGALLVGYIGYKFGWN